MSSNRPTIRSILAPTAARAVTIAAAGVVAAALSLTTSAGAATGTAAPSRAVTTFSFGLQPSSAGIVSCLPNAGGEVSITRNAQNDVMKISVHGLAPNTTFATFVLQEPATPFGLAWYQTDINTNGTGSGTATVQGVFNRETFSVSLGGSAATFAPTSMFHLGLWFDGVEQPFKLGCEPGATTPIVTPFDGDRGAGPQVLNTAQFPVNAGPLSHVPD